jgi:hypothetical protein
VGTCFVPVKKLFNICFYCHYAKFLWQALQFGFGLQSQTSINDMFINWLFQLGCKQRKQILVGATALWWAILTSRNDIIFEKSPIKTYMHVL